MKRRKYACSLFLKLCIILFLVLPFISTAQDFNVSDYGANGKDTLDDTEAIQKAIDDCSNAGGGKVFIPQGNYFSGPIYLKSNMIFEVGIGATLNCTGSLAKFYKMGRLPTNDEISNWKGLHTDFQWINGEGLENLTITGKGKLNGRGEELWWGKQKIRPYVIKLKDCNNVVFEDLWVEESPFHTFNFSNIRKLKIKGITLRNDPLSPNTDAIHLFECKNVLITEVDIDTGDDCILTPRSENIVVSNSTFKTPWGFWWPSGDCRNITINNCVVDCQFLVKDFRKAEDVIISNIVASGPGKLFSSYGGPLKNILIENLRATGWSQGGWFVNGENITLSNIHITRKKGSGNEFLHNGFDFKNVRGLTLRNVRIDNVEEGAAFYGEDISDLSIDGFTATGLSNDVSVFELQNVQDAEIKKVKLDSQNTLLSVNGESTKGLKISDGNRPVVISKEVASDAIQNLQVEVLSLSNSSELTANQRTDFDVKLKNLENKGGIFALELLVDGQVNYRKWVWLEPFEKKEVHITVAELYEAKSYVFSANGEQKLSLNLKASPAQLSVRSLNIDQWDQIAKIGSSILVKVEVQNIGSLSKEFPLELTDNHHFRSSQKINLTAGEKREIVFTYTPKTTGIIKLKLNGQKQKNVKIYDNSLSSSFLHYDFEIENGDLIFDKSGLENHGKLAANAGGKKPAYVPFNEGKALQFNGETAFATIPKLLIHHPMTISMWIKPGELSATSTAGRQMIFYASQDKGNDGYGPEPEMHFMRAAGNTYSMWSNTTGKRLDLRTDIEDTQKWDHVVIVLDTISAIYVNGVLKSQMDFITKPDLSGFVDRIYIGRPNVNYLRYFNGALDELIFYKEALSPAAVKDLYYFYTN